MGTSISGNRYRQLTGECCHDKIILIMITYMWGVIMIRTQVQLTEEQFAALKAASAAEGVSVAELIRVALDRLMETRGVAGLKERKERAAAVAGRFRSGLANLAERHDEYFAETAGNIRTDK